MRKAEILKFLTITSLVLVSSRPAFPMNTEEEIEQKRRNTVAKLESLIDLDPHTNEDVLENPRGTVKIVAGEHLVTHVRQRVWNHFKQNYQGPNGQNFLACEWIQQE